MGFDIKRKISLERRKYEQYTRRRAQKRRDLEAAKKADRPALVKALKTELKHEFGSGAVKVKA